MFFIQLVTFKIMLQYLNLLIKDENVIKDIKDIKNIKDIVKLQN
jgi:hypothetical protein